MKSIVVGGGKIGYYLLKTLKERDYEVTLVERNKEVCAKIAEETGMDIICGDGTDFDTLLEAGIEEADVIVAVTGSDEGNLVICQIAKVRFNVGKTIARISNPKNIGMFKALGVDRAVCSTEVIANLMEYEFDMDSCKIIQSFERGLMLLAEIEISARHPWNGKAIRELPLPGECVIVSILRNDRVIYPRGDTGISDGDKVLIVTNKPVLLELRKSLNGGGMQNGKGKR